MSRIPLAAASVLAVLVAACGSEVRLSLPDAEAVDLGTGRGDAGVRDADVGDAGLRDVGALDVGAPPRDAEVDAGETTDASTDVGTSDLGASDASTPAHVIFVSSVGYTGNLGGLAGADAACAGLASGALLDGTFRAWLSTAAEPAASRLTHGAGPYVLVGGTRVADDWNDLTDGSLDAPIDRDEHGDVVFDDVWTGTLANGSPSSFRCDEWLNDSVAPGRCGTTVASDLQWTDNFTPGCGTTLRLYCVQQ